MFGKIVSALHRARRWVVLSPPVLAIAVVAIVIAEIF
ncbi:hypothetical protein BH09PSE1_BH09PSE1_05300 [soil metagenome]